MGYLSVNQAVTAAIRLSANYSSTCRLISLPFKTPEGRTCFALHIGVSAAGDYPGVLFTGCVHAREWGGAEICIGFAADLLYAFDRGEGLQYRGKRFSAPDVQNILRRLDVFVVPIVNPDGREYSQTQDALWRRNRNPAQSGGDPARIGVDLNRNQDFLWDFPKFFSPQAAAMPYIGSTDTSSELYHGPSAGSETEANNIRWLLDTFPRIGMYMDIHSFGEDVLYSWGDDRNQIQLPVMNFANPAYNGQRGLDADSYEEYIPQADLNIARTSAERVRDAINTVRNGNYTAKQSFYLDVGGLTTYPTSGANDDYAYSRHIADNTKGKVYAFTLEFGGKRSSTAESFHPEWNEMGDIILDIDAGMIELCLQGVSVLRSRRGWLEEMLYRISWRLKVIAGVVLNRLKNLARGAVSTIPG